MYFGFVVPVVCTPRVSVACTDIPVARVGIPVDNVPVIVPGAPRDVVWLASIVISVCSYTLIYILASWRLLLRLSWLLINWATISVVIATGRACPCSWLAPPSPVISIVYLS